MTEDAINLRTDEPNRGEMIQQALLDGFPKVWTPRYAEDHPPVTFMWRVTTGRLLVRSMMKSWPLGLREIASSMAA